MEQNIQKAHARSACLPHSSACDKYKCRYSISFRNVNPAVMISIHSVDRGIAVTAKCRDANDRFAESLIEVRFARGDCLSSSFLANFLVLFSSARFHAPSTAAAAECAVSSGGELSCFIKM